MYEVAVLEAGSARALSRWMEHHGYRYPDGMDATCEDYIDDGWCFVAIKTRVANKRGVDARPGMRALETALPPGASFDGRSAMSRSIRSTPRTPPSRAARGS